MFVGVTVLALVGVFVVFNVRIMGEFQSIQFSLDVRDMYVKLIKCFHVELIF